MERIHELTTLPADIATAYANAEKQEVMHHILKTFGFDVSVLPQEMLDRLDFLVYISDISTDDTRGRVACRSFATLVREYGGPEVFGLPLACISDW